VARARHQPLERRTHHFAGFIHPAGLHASKIARRRRKIAGLSGSNGGKSRENAKGEPEIAARLSPEEIDRLCSLDIHFKHVDATFKTLGLE